MDAIKGIRIILITLLVVVVAWIGLSFYFRSSEVDMNPNAQSYVLPINPSFPLSGFSALIDRVEELPVQPEAFLDLVTEETTD